MSTITTRQAQVTDAATIYEFVCGLEDEQFDKVQFNECYATCLNAPYHHYVMATIDSKAVGYISCHGQVLLHHCGLVYEIQEMYVLPEYRSQGVGKVLLEVLLQKISKDNYVLLEVASNMKRTDAHRFYEANGFVKTTYRFKRTA